MSSPSKHSPQALKILKIHLLGRRRDRALGEVLLDRATGAAEDTGAAGAAGARTRALVSPGENEVAQASTEIMFNLNPNKCILGTTRYGKKRKKKTLQEHESFLYCETV